MEKAEWGATRKRIHLLTFADKFISKHSYKSSKTSEHIASNAIQINQLCHPTYRADLG